MKPDKGWMALVAGMGVALMAVAAAPVVSQTSPEKTKRPVRACVNGPDTRTHVLSESTLLVTDRGRGAVLVEVAGCRLNPFDPLIFKYRGTTQICDPIDLDLAVRSVGGFNTPCFPQSVTPVSPEEATRLSKQKFQSNRDKDAKPAPETPETEE